MTKPILMAEEYWANSYLSIVRHYGRINFNGEEYIIVDKTGRDIFELSEIAEKEGRDKAIEPGEPCDLIMRKWQPIYRKVGRERFIEIIDRTDDIKEAQKFARKGGLNGA